MASKSGPSLATSRGRRIEVRGIVQGVGFRPWVYRLARNAHVAGRVLNHAAGVTIDAFGTPEELSAFCDALRHEPPPAARIEQLRWDDAPFEETSGFTIVASREGPERVVSIPADLATCSACMREIFDPTNRRFRYPFTNCTDCGPRFTIALDVPYDRPKTSMASFVMCPDCQREYDDPADRRFHAQPNACPVCGPRLTAVDARAVTMHVEDPIDLAAQAIDKGLIVALKGIGGFHLACDATSSRAVARLREHKRRDEKPFAVMVRDLDAAEQIAALTDADRTLMTSAARPIVLVERRVESGLAPEVAPYNTFVGLMLPYTPLHHLLLADADRPLIMTSGNLAEEPIAYRNGEALDRLSRVADLFLLHDRPIVTRCDDSVARVTAGRPILFRRSRGYVPRALPLARPLEVPVLGCGALLKNTFCLGRGAEAWLGPHIGDLENIETYRSFEDSIERMERFLGIAPEIIAHDLHPEYLSTQYARSRPEAIKVGVQHHHAHVASAMAEHKLSGPVFGVAYDGTGYGLDGSAWGGELLLAEYDRFERLATFRAIRLAGGDVAIREPWRIALALLDDAFDGGAPIEALALFRDVAPESLRVVRRMLTSGMQLPLAHGVGRYFDAFGAIVLKRPRSRFEGQVALELNMAARPAERGAYPYAINYDSSPWVVDLREGIRAAAIEMMNGEDAGTLAARFHNTICAATLALLHEARRAHGRLPVVLTGGCFQNARLTETLLDAGRELAIYAPGEVPPGDGGIALGQALVADAIASGRRT
ncbi:MAG TPA: carbamoyltransferase HypF [Vicinamibacterales bacterium]|jgi:hydrogenase maturation protein HypF|nr:carbamoyltransferase HypF [Vicinamibacterales bacterium]